MQLEVVCGLLKSIREAKLPQQIRTELANLSGT
jgi:hypothetical protein